MTDQQAREAIQLTRHWGEIVEHAEDNYPIKTKPHLQSDLHIARQIDPVVNSAFQSLQLNETHRHQIDQKLLEFSHKRHRRLSWRDPAVWAMTFACLLLTAYGAWYFWRQLEGFEGIDEASRIVTAGLNDVHEFEPIEVPLGDLDDWFVLQGVNGLWIPPEFAKDISIGARVLHVDGTAIACIAVPAEQMLVYVFPGTPFGIHVNPEKRWKIFDVGSSAAAIIQKGNTCVLVTIRGEKSDLEKIVQRRSTEYGARK